jgi:transposase
LKQNCAKLDHKTITVSKHYSIFEEAKRYSESPDFKDDMKMRAHIEPKQGDMKRFHGLERAKLCGNRETKCSGNVNWKCGKSQEIC